MSKRFRRTLRIGLNWLILGVVIGVLAVFALIGVSDVVLSAGVSQADNYSDYIHSQLPETAYEAYEK